MDEQPDTSKDTPSWPAGGRTIRWRVGMLLGGAALGAFAVALVRWPQLLGWTVAAGVGSIGLLCMVSALLAKSR